MKTQRGSALLVVLGMLAFMVISGVAFSVYMRSARLPASFTRRASSTRQLAKAALAEAIGRIDRSIGNDPHPNVRRNSADKYNQWLGRVLLTPYRYVDDDGETNTKWADEVRQDIVSQMGQTTGQSSTYDPATVPVLTLEALAYIPPPLVNEARYYGRLTPTACWETFDFDAGRYAFVALDVSDYFDVNRLVADEPRSSNPARRVTLGYAFENAAHSSEPSGAGDWDSFMDNYRDIDDTDGSFRFGSSKIPLFSVADFNLAFYNRFEQSGLGKLKSPFCNYVAQNGKTTGFYNATPSTGSGGGDFEKYGEMTFVADSLEAPVPEAEKTVKTDSGTVTVLDLDDEDSQPFQESFLKGEQRNRTLNGIFRMGSSTAGYQRLNDRGLPTVALCALSDYLDGDRIPISLGIPTVERVPMICGIKPDVASANVTLSRVMDEDKTVSGGTEQDVEKIVKRTIHWRLDPKSFAGLVGGGNGVSVLAVYPFRNHEKTAESSFFEMDGKVQFFLSTAEMPLRTGNQGDLLCLGADDEHATRGDVSALCGTAKLVKQAVFNFPLQNNTELSGIPYAAIKEPKDCVKRVELTLDRSACTTLINDELSGDKGDVLRVTYQWKQTPIKDQDGKITDWTPKFENEIPKIGTENADVQVLKSGDDKPAASLLALDADGNADSGFLETAASSPDKDISLFLNMTVTVRVKSSETSILGSSSGCKTLDMVPATAYDDERLNGVANSGSRVSNVGGLPTPLMKFCSATCTINPQTSADVPIAVAMSPTAVMVDDPRYNHAPENWTALSDFSETGWLAAQSSGSRDGDIFMATSDQNYLQSVYEFGFIPRFSDLNTCDNDLSGNLGSYSDAGWKSLCEKAPIDANLMWKTYDVFGRYSDDGDDFEGLGLENRGRGLRVNPYSDSTNVIMAAFANTPHDWRTASEPTDTKLNPGFGLDVASFNKKYAWNEYSEGAKLAWEDLELVAGAFMRCVDACAQNGETWKDAFTDLFDRSRVADTEKYLCGVQLESPSDNIYSVDKKFLYGYWRNCFAARQQLFLVFFRAEPMMLGGGIAGATPPQLGARGVALVWRNPSNPQGSAAGIKGYGANIQLPFDVNTGYIPHQTRVLFYKQFE